MKKNLFVALLVTIGIILILYPFISDYISGLNKTHLIVDYQSKVDDLTDAQKDEKIKSAEKYNKELEKDVQIDISLEEKEEDVPPSYLNLLDVGNTIGYINIPKIDVNLPIYHGTSNDVLQNGVGHLESSSLPVGGKGTHAVLAGHTGLASGKIFDNIDKLEVGDMFYINVLDKTLEYKVDNITVVLPNDTDSIKINPEKDYVTLVTCTPKVVNSHRLLVRGERVEKTTQEKTIQNEIREQVVPTSEKPKTQEQNTFERLVKENKEIEIILGIILILISIFIWSHKFIKDDEYKIISNLNNEKCYRDTNFGKLFKAGGKFEGEFNIRNEKFYKIKIDTKDFMMFKNSTKNKFDFYLLDINNKFIPFSLLVLNDEDSSKKTKKARYKYMGWDFYKEKDGIICLYNLKIDKDNNEIIQIKIKTKYFKKISEASFIKLSKSLLECIRIEYNKERPSSEQNKNIIIPINVSNIVLSNKIKINIAEKYRVKNIFNSYFDSKKEMSNTIIVEDINNNYRFSIIEKKCRILDELKKELSNNNLAKNRLKYKGNEFYIISENNNFDDILFEADNLTYIIHYDSSLKKIKYKTMTKYLMHNLIKCNK